LQKWRVLIGFWRVFGADLSRDPAMENGGYPPFSGR
jgi:hypothetical protein